MLSSGPFRPAADLNQFVDDQSLWLVPGIVPKDGLVVLASSPKTGKTCLATALARALAKGEAFLGKKLEQTPVLWCAHEETPAERQLLHEGLSTEDALLVAYPGQLPALPARLPKTDRYGRRDMREFQEPFVFQHALAVGAKLIVVDCLHAAVEGAPLSDNAVARAVMGTLRTWSFHLHISVLVLHHLTKSGTRGHHPERFSDSAQILAASSCHFFMDREELSPSLSRQSRDGEGAGGGETPGCDRLPPTIASAALGAGGGKSPGCGEERKPYSRITLHGKGRHPAPYARLELLSQGVLDYRIAKADEMWAEPRKRTTEEKVLDLLEEGWSLTSNEIASRLSLVPSTVRVALANLANTARVTTTRAAKSRVRYALNDSE